MKTTDTKIIYENQLPQTLIKKPVGDEPLVIASEVMEGANIGATPSPLDKVVEFQKGTFHGTIKVIAQSKGEAFIAAMARCDFTYNGEEYKLDKKSVKSVDDLLLLQLSFAETQEDAHDIAVRYIARNIKRKGHILKQKDITAKLEETGAPLSDEILGKTNKIKGAIKRKIRGIVSINKYSNMKLVDVTDSDEVSVDDMLANPGVYINTVMTGGKKTLKGEELMRRVYRALYICHRRSLSQTAADFATHYEDIEIGAEKYITKLKTVINSLPKGNVQEFVQSGEIDVLFIDEIDQVLRHLAYGSFDSKNGRVEAYLKLKSAIRNARIVYVADADAGNRVIDFLRSARQNDKETYTIFRSANRKLGVKAIMDDYKLVQAKALNEAEMGKAYVAVDNAKFVEQHGKRDGMLGLTAKNIKEYEHLLADTALLANEGSLFFSPAITSGVSITNDDYTGHFGLFSAVAGITDAVQMLRRDRTAREYLVGVRPSDKVFIDNAEDLLRSWNSDGNEFDAFAARIEAEDNYLRNNATYAMCVVLELAGFDVVTGTEEVGEEETEKAAEAHKKAVDEHTEWRVEQLLKAKPANRSDIKKSREDGESTTHLSFRRERAELERATGKSDITEDDIRISWKDGALEGHVNNLEIAMMGEQAAHSKTLKEIKTKKAARDRVDYAKKHEFANLVFDALNISIERNKSGEYVMAGSFTSDDANDLALTLFERREDFNKARFKTKVPTKCPVQGARMIRNILREFGIKTDSGVSTRREDGNGWINTFTLDEEKSALMASYLTNREKKGLNPHRRTKARTAKLKSNYSGDELPL